jgi:LacI family transcriptional regulator, galactose operon repressor
VAATMRDVAALAGVSVATVSRALAGSPLVGDDVRVRVKEATESLGYVANRLPANLRGKGVRILALVVGNVRNAYFPELIDGSVEAAREAGYPLIFGDSDEDPVRESEILEQLAAERVAGVALATSVGPTSGLKRLMDLGIPVVAVDRRLQGMQVDTVTIDGEQGEYDAVQHLIGLGHRRIGMMGGPIQLSTIADRERGYWRALADAGIEPDPSLVARGDLRDHTARDLALRLMDRPDRPTAIVTINDLSSIGTLRALRALGLKVPQDVSVVGFDDILGAELYDPPLTVIAQPVYDIGQRAIELLARRVATPDAGLEEVAFATRLVVRGSTGPVPGHQSLEEV